MKNLTNKLMIAVGMAALAGIASAQTMKVEVPFSFEVAGTVMPAGSYQVRPGGSPTNLPAIRMVNTDSHRPVLVLPLGRHAEGKNLADAKLVFSCESGSCALAQIWTGSRGAYDVRVAKAHRQQAALISIPATRTE